MTNKWKWDDWQQKVIDYKGNITIRAGRQVGKSTTVGKRQSKLMLDYPGSISLIIAPAQRQSSQLFIKVMSWIEIEHRKLLKKAGGFKPDPKLSMKRNMEAKRLFEHRYGIYNEQPTKTTVVLKRDFTKPPGVDNVGSICYSLPAGKTGVYLRTYALDFLTIDEAAYVPETVYTALKPMLAVSAKTKGLGWETFLSTPFGKGGFFYQSHFSTDYKQFHISSEKCKRIGADFLRKERDRLTKREYAQEYKGEFTEEYSQYFKTDLIKKCMNIIDWTMEEKIPGSGFYLGVDFARLGGDENALVIAELFKTNIKIVKAIVAPKAVKNPTIDIIERIIEYNKIYKFNRIFVDSGGLGGPIMDILHQRLGKRKIVGLDNATKRIEEQGEEKKRGIFKQDLYANTLLLMETDKLSIINHLKLLRSMKSITYEYSESISTRNLKIYGTYTHLTEALVRACWCIKERGLNLYIY